MHYQERKYKFKNYMRNSYKCQRYEGSNRPSNLQIIYIQEKNRTMKIKTNLKH